MKGTTGFKLKTTADDMERVIEKSDTSSSINSDDLIKPQRSFREQLRHVLHTNKFQILVICLVVLDCLLVIAELLIDLKVFETSEEKQEDKESESHPEEKKENISILLAQVLHYCSIAILSIFLVELCVKLFALGKEFFHHKMEILDGIIVVVSFALDVAFANQEGIDSALGLLIILRLWRVGRILNGIVLSIKTQSEKRLAKEKQLKEAAEEELAKFREYCAAQEREIEVLQSLLTKHNITFQKMDKPQLSVSTISVVAEVNQYIEATKVASDDSISA